MNKIIFYLLMFPILVIGNIANMNAQEKSTSSGDTIYTQFFVDGICGMCKERIEEAIHDEPGLIRANWDVDTRQLSLWSKDTLDARGLQRSLADAGHDTELYQAADSVYHSIDACCKYRDPDIIEAHGHDPDHRHESEYNIEFVDAQVVQGIVLEMDNKGKELPVIGANIYWSGTSTGVVTDVDGYFSLDYVEDKDLVVSYIGYDNDTLSVNGKRHLEIILSDVTMMREVTITHKKRSTDVSWLEAGKVQNIGEKELLKAACCNLSESFETNPTVDATATDAVTGTRKIEMLGLAGPNIQITREGIPDIRGLAAIYGLNFTPGPWIEGIQINTGTGSVVNGFESIAGQIDIALKKPKHHDRFYLNLYGNEMSRVEGNVAFNHTFSDKVATSVLLHGSSILEEHDNNRDGFHDHPISNQWIGLNRWKFHGQNGFEAQAGIKVTSLNNRTGQIDFDPDIHKGGNEYWGAQMDIAKIDGWIKVGKVFPSKPYASIGLQLAGSYFDQEAYFGQRTYNGDQSNFYSNLIYQSIISDTRHKFKTGLSFQHDSYNELVATDEYERRETVPGAFFEYSFQPDDRLSLVAGLRADHHNNYGFFMTPRLHLRYMPAEGTVFRLSGGRGQRTASIFAEHIGAFASNRQLIVHHSNEDSPYGLDAEVSWSGGFGYQQEVNIADRPLLLQVDYYYTDFQNQIVVDWDASPQALQFYNLDGRSYSSSLQAQIDYELIPGLDLRLAWRQNEVKTTYDGALLAKPLIARNRVFVNAQYSTDNGWSFDYTLNWLGEQRLPSTESNPEPYQLDSYTPSYTMSNAQVSKSWNKRFDLYVGAMNLWNFTQNDPIMSSEDPFQPVFDASMIWAPVFGREIYGGIRWRILK